MPFLLSPVLFPQFFLTERDVPFKLCDALVRLLPDSLDFSSVLRNHAPQPRFTVTDDDRSWLTLDHPSPSFLPACGRPVPSSAGRTRPSLIPCRDSNR